MQQPKHSDTIQVIGIQDLKGLLPDQVEPKAISAFLAAFISKQAPTINAFHLVSLLRVANVSSSDPFGLSATSGMTLRGLGQDQIGVLLEGAPQDGIGYSYAYSAQFADAENLRHIEVVTRGAGIDAPVVAATGSVLSLTLDDPRTTGSALADLSTGSYGERRVFARIDTGSIGTSGSGSSYSRNRADNWRGAGFDKR